MRYHEFLLSGLIAGVAYGAIESLFVDAAPQVVEQPQAIALETGLLALLVYSLCGVLIGAATALAASRSSTPNRWVTAGPLLTFLLIHSLHLGVALEPSLAWFLAWAFPLAQVLGVIHVARGRNQRWLRAVSAAVPAFILAIGVPWLLYGPLGGHDQAIKLAEVAIFVLAVGLAANALQKWSPRAVHLRLPGTMGLAFVVLVSASAFYRQAPLVLQPGSSPPSAPLPSVIMISMDTVRADHLSVYGYGARTSPWLEDFARSATLYERSFSSSNMTLPSHASLFTGLYPRSHGAHYSPPDKAYGAPLEESFVTLAEILDAEGYRTVGVVANWAYLNRKHKLSQGFQYWDDRRGWAWLTNTKSYFMRSAITRPLIGIMPLKASGQHFRDATTITDTVLSHLEAIEPANDRRPLFLFVNYMDAHWPYLPPPAYRQVSPHKETIRDEDYKKLKNETSALQRMISDAERSELIARYDASLAYEDAEIQRLFAGLGRLGFTDEAIIVITSDHGEAFGDRSLVGHTVSVYNDQILVPLVVRFPGQTNSVRDERLASSIDIVPTVLDVLGLPQPETLQGESLLDPGSATRSVFSESYQNAVRIKHHPRFDHDERAVLHGHYKLITSSRKPLRLYDLAEDPDERRNLVDNRPDTTQFMEQALQDWITKTPEISRLADAPADRMDNELKSRLKSLGYIH